MGNYNNGNKGFELDWGSEIENDSPDFIVLPEGEYDFTVKCFERGRYNGGDKVGPCPKAMLTLSIDTPQGEALVKKGPVASLEARGTAVRVLHLHRPAQARSARSHELERCRRRTRTLQNRTPHL